MKKTIIMIAIFMASVAGANAQTAHNAHFVSNEVATATNGTSNSLKSEKYKALYKGMQKLWSDHMYWTLNTVDAFFNEPDQLDTKLTRLLDNQRQIGDAIKPYYGEAAGNKLTDLLQEHIKLAVPILTAAKAGDNAGIEQGVKNWYVNAQEIADFLSAANPKSWPASATRPALEMHITHTVAYSVDVLKGDYKKALEGFEEALNHMLGLGDILADGIYNQFPNKF